MKTQSSRVVKLYHVKRGQKFKLTNTAAVPPLAPEGVLGDTYKLGRLDGMYSWSIGEDGNRYYFAGDTKVEVLDG